MPLRNEVDANYLLALVLLGTSWEVQMKERKGNEPHRSTVYWCQEVYQYVLHIQKERRRLGLNRTKLNDICNDLMMEHMQCVRASRGLPPYPAYGAFYKTAEGSNEE